MDQQPLVCTSHTTQYIGAVLVGILIGTGVSFAYFKQASADDSNTYQAGFDSAKKRVLESPMGMVFRTPDDVRTLTGLVNAVSGNHITLHAQAVNPFDDASLDDRTVTITTNTKITKLSQKDPKTFQSEMDAFIKKMQAGSKSVPQTTIPPEPFVHTTATVSEITAGDILNVTAGENIKTVKEFTASEIQIQPKPIIN